MSKTSLYDRNTVTPDYFSVNLNALPSRKAEWAERVIALVRTMNDLERAVLVQVDDEAGTLYTSTVENEAE